MLTGGLGVERTLAPFVTQGLYQIGRIMGMDLNIKGLDDNVGRRLREQAEAAGLSVQQYVREHLTRIASRPSPAEFVRDIAP